MNCSKANKLLYLYAGIDLTKFKKAKVAKHLIACVKCRSELERIKSSINLMTETIITHRDEPVLDHLWQHVITEVNPVQLPQEQKKHSSLLYRIAFSIASLKKLNRIFTRKIRFTLASLGLIVISMSIILFLHSRGKKQIIIIKQKPQQEILDNYPIVEHVKGPDITVMTIQTNDPNIKVVWFFDDNFKL